MTQDEIKSSFFKMIAPMNHCEKLFIITFILENSNLETRRADSSHAFKITCNNEQYASLLRGVDSLHREDVEGYDTYSYVVSEYAIDITKRVVRFRFGCHVMDKMVECLKIDLTNYELETIFKIDRKHSLLLYAYLCDHVRAAHGFDSELSFDDLEEWTGIPFHKMNKKLVDNIFECAKDDICAFSEFNMDYLLQFNRTRPVVATISKHLKPHYASKIA